MADICDAQETIRFHNFIIGRGACSSEIVPLFELMCEHLACTIILQDLDADRRTASILLNFERTLRDYFPLVI